MGAQDFAECFNINYFKDLKKIIDLRNITSRYLNILAQVKVLGKNIKPILITEPCPLSGDSIYKVLKYLGRLAVIINFLCVTGIAAAVTFMITRKIDRYVGGVFVVMGISILYVSRKLVPFKVTRSVFKQNGGKAVFETVMERFYRPVLEAANKNTIPILDLTNSFNIYASSVHPPIHEIIQQIIIEGIARIMNSTIKESLIWSCCYEKDENESLKYSYSSNINMDPYNWRVYTASSSNVPVSAEAKVP
ncbi:MAG: hypothetical protein ACRDFB_02125 [Rhabdochlamydiaceae bacterium]